MSHAAPPERSREHEALSLDPLATLPSRLWRSLRDVLTQRRHPPHPWRTPVVATVDESGQPQARTVVLREVDPGSGTLAFHTDLRAPKLVQLQSQPAVTWVFYDPESGLQLRASSTATLHHDDDLARAQWEQLPELSRSLYTSERPPGRRLDDLAEAHPEAQGSALEGARGDGGRMNFVLVRCHVHRFDCLHLDPAGHRRAAVVFDGLEARAHWIAP